MAEILKDVFEDEKGNQHYIANNTETTFDQNGTPLNNGGDLSEASVNFTVSTARKALTAKARFKALLGDIAKWLTDLGTAAFKNVANNDTTTVDGFVADARIVKTHGDEIDGLYQNLDGAKIIHEGSGADVKYYAQLGADAASKKLLGNTPCYIKTWTGGNGGVQTINIPISDYPDYQQLSVNNFKAGVTSLQGAMGQGWINGITDYNANTGIVTVSYANHGSAALTGFLAISSAGFTDL